MRPLLKRLTAGASVALVAAAVAAPPVAAEVPELLTQVPADLEAGSGAGQMKNPRGLAADPLNGHVYVADRGNARVDEFTAWGEFVKAWGWDVAPEGAPGDTFSNQFEICTATCKAGVTGNSAGQFTEILGIALDVAGDVYVYESLLGGMSPRVQKFSPTGEFLLMFGGEVNQGPHHPGDVCTAQHLTEGDTCGAGVAGTADGWFSNSSIGNYIAYSSDTNSIFVGDKERVQKFEPNGTFKANVEFPGETVSGLALDGDGNFYLLFSGKKGVYKFDATGKAIEPEPFLVAEAPRGITVDVAGSGNIYVIVDPDPNGFGTPKTEQRVLEYDASGKCLNCGTAGEDGEDGFDRSTKGIALNGIAIDSACGVTDLYVSHFIGTSEGVSYLKLYGPHPDPGLCPPPAVVPTIAAQYALSVDTNGAVLRADINPHFWGDTTYYVQYGTFPCSAGGCESTPVPPASLGGKATGFPVKSGGVFLSDLQPDTTYHYRFVSESSGGGPAFGPDASFKTFPTPSLPNPDCPNRALRGGPSTALPDCRAYELVSPLDKSGGDVVRVLDKGIAGLNQSSGDGNKLTYSSLQAFAGAQSAPAVSQYFARREPLTGGWSNEAISTPRGQTTPLSPSQFLMPEFKAFSADLCQAWLRHDTEPQLDPIVPSGFDNLYRREGCAASPTFAALTPIEPPSAAANDYVLELQGTSADGSLALYRALDQLTPDAAAKAGVYQLYEHSSATGETSLVSILPDGTPCQKGASAGTDEQGERDNRQDSLVGALSADGDRIFWTCARETGSGNGGTIGPLYVKVKGEPESRHVSQAAEALSKTNASRFWGAANDGSAAVFTSGDGFTSGSGLYRFEVEEDKTIPLAGGVVGVLGVSEDASRVYFLSKEDLGGGAVEGSPNLYLYAVGEEGKAAELRFIATLSASDAIFNSGPRSPVAARPSQRTSRISADGLRVAFMSTAPLTGYDNTDAETGVADAEVYLYDAVADELLCVSCNPSGARPVGRDIETGTGGFTLRAAALLPPWQTQFYPGRSLSSDGARLFFDSFEALRPEDTNGRRDVYQWERAGTGDCSEDDSVFVEASNGCLALISSGKSPQDSAFLDASPSGADVFIATGASLVSQDYGLVDIYDARVGGGFPPPSLPSPGCEGEACQGQPVPPDDPTPASSVFEGAGNVTEAPQKTRCAKGRVRRRGRCVPRGQRKRAHRPKQANSGRRAGR